MKTSKEQKAEQERKIEAIKARVSALLPAGWKASRCFLMSLSGAGSPEMITCYREGYQEAQAGRKGEERKAAVMQWRKERAEQAQAIMGAMKAAGLDVRNDHGDLYVLPEGGAKP